VTNLKSSSLSLFEGNGDGTFLPLPGYSTTNGSQPAASLAADLNADGTPEIVSVLYGSNALYVLQNGRIQGVMLKGVALSMVGTINLTAAYTGDSLYAASTSTAYPFTGSSTTAVAPVFSPAAGSYPTAQSVTLSSTTAGASIHYTLDGSTPTSKSNTYASAIPVNASLTISAIAIAAGYTNSSVAKGAYIIETPAAAPVFSPPAGKYTGTKNVTLKSTTPGATIYYTVNGATPTTASVKYSGAIPISASTTLQAIATATNYTSSTVTTAVYTITRSSHALTSSASATKAHRSIQRTAVLPLKVH